MGKTFKNILGDLRHFVSELTGEAARVAEAGLADLEAEAGKVHTTVTELMVKAETDAEAAVAAAEPEVKMAVGALVANLRADIEAALASLAVHAL